MLWIGITGSVGSGKSTFSGLLRNQGEVVLDADELAKIALEPGADAYKKVIKEFGADIVSSEGVIDRARLAQLVFSDKAKLDKLESIIHPEVRLAVDDKKNEFKLKNAKFLFYDVPLLFEKKMEKSFDLVVMITCSEENQLKRIKLRNKWSEEEIKIRLSAQLSPAEKESKAHVVIRNDSDLTALKMEVIKFLEWLNTIS